MKKNSTNLIGKESKKAFTSLFLGKALQQYSLMLTKMTCVLAVAQLDRASDF